MDGTLILGSLGIILCAAALLKAKNRRIRRWRTRPINRERNTKNGFIYFTKMMKSDPAQFFKLTRMTVPIFEELLSTIEDQIRRRHIIGGISAEQRLAITLHYLSQGIATIHKIIIETCTAIWIALSPVYLRTPNEEQWKHISKRFFECWNYPHCLGAIDGKHIAIQAPPNSGSLFFNYKKFHSIVLLATCNADYVFTMVDIGGLGSQSDGGIFNENAFGKMCKSKNLNIPEPQYITNTNIKMPFMFVADEAFPLKKYISRPYPGRNLTMKQRIFNYRVSRARRTIENTFGILVSTWRILKQTIVADIENIDTIVKACVVLHYFCKIKGIGKEAETSYCPPGYVDNDDLDNGIWRNEIDTPLQSVRRLGANNAVRILYDLRNNLADYFISPEGRVPWQKDRVFGYQTYNLKIYFNFFLQLKCL